MLKTSRILGTLTAVSAALIALAVPAQATGSTQNFALPYGTFQIKAYHCTTFISACDWRSETLLLDNGGRIMDNIQNRSRLEAHGVDVSLTISANPEATITGISRSIGDVRWKRFVSNNVVNKGQMRPGGATTYVSVDSCGSGDGPGSQGFVSEKCAYAGAF